MKKKILKQALSMIAVLTLLLGILPANAWALDHVHDAACGYSEPSECTHAHDGACGYVAEVLGVACGHSHDDACGYSEGSAGTPCGHVHGDCGYAEAIPGTPCTHDCASGGCTLNEDGVTYTCAHTHGDCGHSEGTPASACSHTQHTDCGYVPEVPGTACNHSHDNICGYVEAVSGNPCTHTHDAACGYSEGAACNYAVVPANEHTHVWSTEWSGNNSYHWHECIADGCDLIQSWGEGKGDYAKHEFDITRDTHSYVDNIGFGYHNGTCKLCGLSDSEIIIAATLQFDNTHHWYECPCGVNGWLPYIEKMEHRFDDDADTTCNDCGYDRTPKSPASVTKAPEAITGLKFKEENGIEVQQILVTAGEAAGGTMVYRIDDGEWSTTIPARGQVRDYTVYYKVRGDSDHNDSAEGSVRVSIAKADAPIVSIPTQQHVYTIPTTGNSINIKSLLPNLCAIIDDQSRVTETTGDFIKNAVLNNGVLTYDTDAVNAPSTGTIKVKIVMRNYEDVTVTVNVELINLSPVSNSGNDAEITYNGSTYDVAQMFTKDTNAGEASYEISGGSGAGELNGSVLTITKAGTIEIKLTTAANGTYAAGEATATLTVRKGNYDVSVSIEGWTYGDRPNDPTSDGPGEVTYTYDNETGAYGGTEPPTDARMWVVVATYTGNDLYNGSYAYTWFTIAKKELTPIISGSVSKNYDGTTAVPADHDLSIMLDGIILGDDISVTATYAYESAEVGTTKIIASDITLGGEDGKNYTVAAVATADVGEILHSHSYGTEWKSDGTNHWHECSCGAKKDVAAHSGGKATCTEKAKCSICGNSYGEKDSNNHSFIKYVSDKNATCKKNGTETAKCDHGCGKTHTRTDWGSKLGHNFVNGVCTRCKVSQWNPDTGDKIMIAVTVLALSGAALLLLLVFRKKQRIR